MGEGAVGTGAEGAAGAAAGGAARAQGDGAKLASGAAEADANATGCPGVTAGDAP